MENRNRRKKKREVAVIDFETDPFLYGRSPAPFAAGFAWGDIYIDFWGDDCAQQLVAFLATVDTPLIIYAHNGGKFDFIFILRELENPVRLIHGRIAKAKLGIHEVRDSWLINPQPLSAFKKDAIDYSLFERPVREKHREEILRYLRGDCVYLLELCAAFNDRFGPKLTAPGAAMTQLREFHPQRLGGKSHDDKFRRFYFGGRVECFESGVMRGDFKVYDVNSMYPHVMRSFDHPHGTRYIVKFNAELDRQGWIKRHPGRTYFARVSGFNKRALPVRLPGKNGGLTFDQDEGEFLVCSHELRAAIELKLFKVSHIHEVYLPCGLQRFDGFVDKFFADKVACKRAGDKIGEIFAKLILNSAYGKFGQNPADFRDYLIEVFGRDCRPDVNEWALHETNRDYRIWKKREGKQVIEDGESAADKKDGYFDVAIAASVTSAARSVLMRAIASANRPIYCDTDSVICQGLRGVRLHDSDLGAWKLEGRGNRLAVAGKKLYALFDGDSEIKSASKGVRIDPLEIERVAAGEVIEWHNAAPSFSLDGGVKFISRKARATA